MKIPSNNISFQKKIAIIGIILFIGKVIAWKLTHSDAIFSDAMESIVNIISAFLGLYSLYLAQKPKDKEHPYGHGKVEFVTAGVEGALIAIAGVLIIYKAIDSLLTGNLLAELDWGIAIVALTAIINYVLGYLSIKKGEKENSLVLISSGKHLQSDTITTFGVAMSLIIVAITHIGWLDAVLASFFGFYIIYIGYQIIRKALRGIMDEQDPALLKNLIVLLQENRKSEWIDIHNLKIQQFGSSLHIDAHLTLPWYFTLKKAHHEMEDMIHLILKNTDRTIEFNFHMDDCKPFSCSICKINDCTYRSAPYEKSIIWSSENASKIEKHDRNTTI